MQAELAAIERDESLAADAQFSRRAAALDTLDFLLTTADAPTLAMGDLCARAERMQTRLEAIDNELFTRLRTAIATGVLRGETLRQQLALLLPDATAPSAPGYDAADVFFSRLLHHTAPPPIRRARTAEMVAYQPTPARIVLELLEQVPLSAADVFVDIGAGLGRVPLMVGLLSEVRAIGIEIEADYCRYARSCAEALGLQTVQFLNADACSAHYSEGTVFYLYTPFVGSLLDTTLAQLRRETQQRAIRIVSYGPCTAQIARLRWLRYTGTGQPQPERISVFGSVTKCENTHEHTR